MDLTWDILYRGPLDSCNYDCGYCPFAKRENSRAKLEEDARKLHRFVSWVGEQRGRRIGVLFTPWGEALIHRAYQEAIATMSRLDHIYRVAIQTNLSGRLDWLADADRSRAAIWATFHPSQIALDRFLQRCGELDVLGVRYSVGIVGRREHFDAMEQLRAALPAHVYVWVNAYKDEPRYYDDGSVRRIEQVDPFFRLNLHGHASRGRACAAGETSFAVDGDGDMFRCHFIAESIGNIYRDNFASALQPRTCSRSQCTCHIGYVHLKELRLREAFGDGLLERIPLPAAWADAQSGGHPRSSAARTAQV
jgi:sulfatase maturation enzyme AslB (radical SAM superfamily)